ncbi:MAG: dTDP-4-dehydrorhamnose reductase [Candidatus Heimdallarchaeota archaeon]|nr:dTDP-4-dehydrorhamnose reductase [Candidatus Heimdallarchaeota archaeon]
MVREVNQGRNNNLKVAIIGSNGQLGTDLIVTAPLDVEIISVPRSALELTDIDQIENFFDSNDFSWVINAAAFHKTLECEKRVEKTFNVNAFSVKKMAELCRGKMINFFQISTDYVFGPNQAKRPFVETDPVNPLNVYGASKASAEFFLNYILPDNHYIGRISSLFGKAGSSGKGTNFVYTMLQKAEDNAEIKVIDDIFMSPTYTIDAGKLIWEIIQDHKKNGIYHLSNSGGCSWYTFTKEILKQAGFKDVKITPISKETFGSNVVRPSYTVLGTNHNLNRSHWKDGLNDFLAEIQY